MKHHEPCSKILSIKEIITPSVARKKFLFKNRFIKRILPKMYQINIFSHIREKPIIFVGKQQVEDVFVYGYKTSLIWSQMNIFSTGLYYHKGPPKNTPYLQQENVFVIGYKVTSIQHLKFLDVRVDFDFEGCPYII